MLTFRTSSTKAYLDKKLIFWTRIIFNFLVCVHVVFYCVETICVCAHRHASIGLRSILGIFLHYFQFTMFYFDVKLQKIINTKCGVKTFKFSSGNFLGLKKYFVIFLKLNLSNLILQTMILIFHN